MGEIADWFDMELVEPLARHAGAVTVAEPAAFLDAVQAAVRAAADPAGVEHRRSVARDNPWDRALDEILRRLAEIGAPSRPPSAPRRPAAVALGPAGRARG